MFKISEAKTDLLFSEIAKHEALYIPVDKTEGNAAFEKWKEGAVMTKALKTSRSAKDFFFPQTESLVNFKVEGKNIEIEDPRRETEDFVVFGVRACDARSFSVLDKVFLADPVDSYYKNRREHATIITLACARPAETCFCKTFGINPAEPEGDISCWMDGGFIYLQDNTEKGKALIGKIESVLEASDDKAVEAQKKKINEIMDKLPLAGLDTDGFKGDVLDEKFNSEKWAELSRTCLGCGTCTYVCPTCQCYDIKDFDTGHGVKRFRCWDSCMYSDFTKMSAGQPRLTQLERFRQRFMHKLVYFPMNNGGQFGCVGCGRCLAKCPASLNIVKVIKALGGKKDE